MSEEDQFTTDATHRGESKGSPPNGPLMDASVPRAGKWDQKGTGVHTHLHAYGGIYSRLFGFLSHVLELCGPEREN